MAEDCFAGDNVESPSAAMTRLSADGDITPGVYEGGFKTWECAVDLAEYLAARWEGVQAKLGAGGLHVVEVGDLGSVHFLISGLAFELNSLR